MNTSNEKILNLKETKGNQCSSFFSIQISVDHIIHSIHMKGNSDQSPFKVGANIWDVIDPFYKDQIYENVIKTQKSGDPTCFEVHTLDQKYFDVLIYPTGNGIAILGRDISEKKALDHEIEEYLRHLTLLMETADNMIHKENPKDLLDSLFNTLSKYLDLDFFLNYIYKPDLNKLSLMNYGGVSKKEAQEIEWLEMGEAICGMVAFSRRGIVVERVQEHEDPRLKLVQSFGVKAYVCYPLISYKQLIGTLSFGSKKKEIFQQKEIRLIEKICSHVARVLERMLLFSELERKRKEAEKANKAKTDFLAMISHEFRTPLNSILGFVQILSDDRQTTLDEKQRNHLKKIKKAGNHLLSMINELLSFVHLDMGIPKIKMEKTNVMLNAQECIDILHAASEERKIHIHMNVDEKWYTCLETNRLKQVLMILLSNAIKYSYPNGNIWISATAYDKDIRISVKDDGIGIDPLEHEMIFKPFYRSKNTEQVEGSGIGLALVQQLITEIGGTIGVHSELGKGSEFWIQIPLVK